LAVGAKLKHFNIQNIIYQNALAAARHEGAGETSFTVKRRSERLKIKLP
jgi:hypothetical protein